MNPTIITNIDDTPTLRGRTFTGDWFRVAADRLVSFEHASYFVEDDEPDFYPEGLVEGFHLLALLDHLGSAVLQVDPASIIAWNYGMNRARFITPVRVGKPIRLTGTIVDITPKNGGYLLTTDYTIELKGAERPAFTAQMLVLWLPLEND